MIINPSHTNYVCVFKHAFMFVYLSMGAKWTEEEQFQLFPSSITISSECDSSIPHFFQACSQLLKLRLLDIFSSLMNGLYLSLQYDYRGSKI